MCRTILLSNAIKFTESGEVILQIDVGQPTDRTAHIAFHVIDTGIGIAPKHQAMIFSAFDQAQATEPQEGTGLGLTIAQKHVALMGGHLAVESQLGSGSRFYFTLPLIPQAMRGAEIGEAPVQRVQLAANTRVKALVVDDVADNRTVLTYMLEAIGVEVETKAAGLPALEQITTDRPDIVFMDIRMPQVDGLSAVQQIIDMYGEDCPKLVAVSASALSHERKLYFAAGFDDFIPKPVVAQLVHDCLARLLQINLVSTPMKAVETAVGAVNLPDDLYHGIKQAAETYRVTQLDRYFDAIAQLSPFGHRLAERLREYNPTTPLEQKGLYETIARPISPLRNGKKMRVKAGSYQLRFNVHR